MNVEIISPTEIRLRAETELEHSILHAGEWTVVKCDPEPMKLYAQELKLKRTDKQP